MSPASAANALTNRGSMNSAAMPHTANPTPWIDISPAVLIANAWLRSTSSVDERRDLAGRGLVLMPMRLQLARRRRGVGAAVATDTRISGSGHRRVVASDRESAWGRARSPPGRHPGHAAGLTRGAGIDNG